MRKFLSTLLLFSYIIASAQVMNTRKWRKKEKDSLDNALVVFDEKRYTLALPIFEQLYKSHPNETFLKYTYGTCALYKEDKHEDAYTLLSEIYAKNKKAENIELDLARAALYNNKLDEAENFITSFLKNKRSRAEDKKFGETIKRYIANAKYFQSHPTKAKITNLGNVVNSEAHEYVPAITADESKIIFTYVGPKSKGGKVNDFLQPDPYGDYREDIFVSTKINDKFSPPVSIDTINTVSNDAAVSLSYDGSILFIYKETGDDHGDLYQSYLIGDNYSKPQKLRGQVNSYSYENHCSLSPDGKTLYFTSERPGGYGGLDIYKATLMPDSSWGNVKNLGDSVNTSYDDGAPYIHPDGVTLYFSSKGRSSMGDYDIFRATLDLKDSIFRKVENLGFPINSTGNDIYFALSADGKRGYYSSGKRGGYGLEDLYTIETNFENKPVLYMVKGKTTYDNKEISANVKVEITTKNNAIYKSFKTNEKTGKFIVPLPPGNDYEIKFSDDKGNYKKISISASNLTEYKEDDLTINFSSEPVKTETTVASTDKSNTDNFKPNNNAQEKAKSFAELYGDISSEGVDFRVQVAAYKFPKNYRYPHLKGLGKVEQLLLDDKITRITIGGKFNTLNKAYSHMKKVIAAGQKDAFVTVVYRNKRLYLDELVKMGIFKKL
ncbi:MAG: PD40 domain-containing protein [Bacteroidetes bacterium]|nr:PD40 domain-containing protein [Bacteroidota bacterium]